MIYTRVRLLCTSVTVMQLFRHQCGTGHLMAGCGDNLGSLVWPGIEPSIQLVRSELGSRDVMVTVASIRSRAPAVGIKRRINPLLWLPWGKFGGIRTGCSYDILGTIAKVVGDIFR